MTTLAGPSTDLSGTKFGSQPNAYFKYEEAGWLIAQMPGQSLTVQGQLQFGVWQLFNPGATPDQGQSTWLTQAAQVDYSKWNFSTMQIYTATNTVNQEFIGGSPSAVPLPGSVLRPPACSVWWGSGEGSGSRPRGRSYGAGPKGPAFFSTPHPASNSHLCVFTSHEL